MLFVVFGNCHIPLGSEKDLARVTTSVLAFRLQTVSSNNPGNGPAFPTQRLYGTHKFVLSVSQFEALSDSSEGYVCEAEGSDGGDG
eukprot:gene22361-biopygen7952